MKHAPIVTCSSLFFPPSVSSFFPPSLNLHAVTFRIKLTALKRPPQDDTIISVESFKTSRVSFYTLRTSSFTGAFFLGST